MQVEREPGVPVARRRRGGRVARAVAGLGAVPALLLGVLPSAEAGQVPLLVRRPAGAVVRLDGPPPEAYPYRAGGTPRLDAYGFVTGQCTSFAAWWLDVHGVPLGVLTVGPGGPAWFLNASSWDGSAVAAGYRVGRVPVVGALAQWHAGESNLERRSDGRWHTSTAGRAGHVAVVVRVLPGGEVDWLDHGAGGRTELHRGRGFAPRYLYVGVTAPGT